MILSDKTGKLVKDGDHGGGDGWDCQEGGGASGGSDCGRSTKEIFRESFEENNHGKSEAGW